jgi:hypothetical protein
LPPLPPREDAVLPPFAGWDETLPPLPPTIVLLVPAVPVGDDPLSPEFSDAVRKPVLIPQAAHIKAKATIACWPILPRTANGTLALCVMGVRASSALQESPDVSRGSSL